MSDAQHDIVAESIDKIHRVPLLTVIPVKIDFPLLKVPEYNPKGVTEEAVIATMKSIKNDPDWLKLRPIVINVHEGREGVIIAGSVRWHACARLGMDTFPGAFVDCDLKTERERNVRDNAQPDAIDYAKMGILLTDIRNDGSDMEAMGLLPDQVIGYISPPGEGDATDSGDYNGTTPSKTKTVECPSCKHVFPVTKEVIVKTPPADTV